MKLPRDCVVSYITKIKSKIRDYMALVFLMTTYFRGKTLAAKFNSKFVVVFPPGYVHVNCISQYGLLIKGGLKGGRKWL